MKYLAFNRELHLATNKGYRTGNDWGGLQQATRYVEPPDEHPSVRHRLVPEIDLHAVVARAVYVSAFACSDFADAPLAARIEITATLARRINELLVMMAEYGIDECVSNDGVDWVHADDMSLDSDAMEVFSSGAFIWRAYDSIGDKVETRQVPLDLLFCSPQTVVESEYHDDELRAALIERGYISADAP